MEIKMKKKLNLMLTILLGISPIIFIQATEVPSYNEIFAQQLKCNSRYFTNPQWEKKLQLLQRMDTSTYVVISNPTITELPPPVYQNVAPEYKGMKERRFKVKATKFSTFQCITNKQTDISSLKESSVETLIEIFETKAGTGKFHIALAEPAEVPGSDAKINSDFLTNPSEDDKKSGMICVVLIDDFLKNSNTVNVDNLCPGKLAKNKAESKLASYLRSTIF
jgi:hypothetical protein